jgi:hypothetical protein
MGKRKAADAADAGRPQALAAQPRREPVVVAGKRLKRKEELARTLQRGLNQAFSGFVAANGQQAQSLEDACRQYIAYSDDIKASAALRRAAPPDLATRPGGAVYVVGSGDNGQLGLGEEVVECARPRVVLAFGDLRVKLVAVGGMHTLAITEDGVVWSWGVNDEGALGRVVRGFAKGGEPLFVLH